MKIRVAARELQSDSLDAHIDRCSTRAAVAMGGTFGEIRLVKFRSAAIDDELTRFHESAFRFVNVKTPRIGPGRLMTRDVPGTDDPQHGNKDQKPRQQSCHSVAVHELIDR